MESRASLLTLMMKMDEPPMWREARQEDKVFNWGIEEEIKNCYESPKDVVLQNKKAYTGSFGNVEVGGMPKGTDLEARDKKELQTWILLVMTNLQFTKRLVLNFKKKSGKKSLISLELTRMAAKRKMWLVNLRLKLEKNQPSSGSQTQKLIKRSVERAYCGTLWNGKIGGNPENTHQQKQTLIKPIN